MSFPAWFDPGLCERLTLTLLHFLWQGAVIAVCTAILNRLMHQAASHSRYVMNVTALIAMACCLPVTFSQVSVPISASTHVSLSPAPVEAGFSRVPPRTDHLPSMGEVNVFPSAGGLDGGGPTLPEVSSVASQVEMPPQLPGHSAEVSEPQDEVPSETFTQKLLRWCAPYVTTVYLIGVFGLIVRQMRGAWLSRQLIHTSPVVTEPELLTRLQAQTALLGLRVLPVMKSCANAAASYSVAGVGHVRSEPGPAAGSHGTRAGSYSSA